jgi:glutamate formiminotransferase
MTDAIVQCVPNFSEGRRPDVVDALADTIAQVARVRVLHITSDPDHNRSVITFAGAPEAVAEAAFRAVRHAAEVIDMRQHRGQHPRMGAADVVPFVPIAGISLEECAAIARRVGQRVGEELNLPVYLYEAAALRPERRNLADVRRGEYEGLLENIHREERLPDYGPARVGSAGAVIIGARQPLIAFNLYLNTDRVEIARQIAQAVRHSSGGLAGVKALGLLVGGQAQVSLNLVDYEHTPLYRAVELVRLEVARYGAVVTHTELIGLMPLQAALDALAWYLQLPQLTKTQVIEHHFSTIVE